MSVTQMTAFACPTCAQFVSAEAVKAKFFGIDNFTPFGDGFREEGGTPGDVMRLTALSAFD